MLTTNEAPAALRVGVVTEFDHKTLRARVQFPDMDLVSYWLPVLVTNTAKTKDYCFLDEGEHVVCAMLGTGTEMGFILGAFYDDKNMPAVQDKDKRTVMFDDGCSVVYDRKASTLNINCPNEIIIQAGSHIKLQAGRIDLN